MAIAMGSASEVEYLLLLANDLEMMKPSDYSVLADGVVEIKQMLSTFIKRIRQNTSV